MYVKKVLMILILSMSCAYGQEYPHPETSYNTALSNFTDGDVGQAMYHAKRATRYIIDYYCPLSYILIKKR